MKRGEDPRLQPRRGDAIWLNFKPQSGHEKAGRRPAIFLSPGSYNGRTGLAILCPITEQVKGYPFEVAVPSRLRLAGVILADQVKSVDWRARDATFLSVLPAHGFDAVLEKVGTLLAKEES